MLRKISIFAILLSVLLLPVVAATGDAAWDSDKLDQPIAVDGRINKDDGTFSFILNSPDGIPDEPVYVRAKLSPDINPLTGYREDPVTHEPIGERLFDPDKIAFDSSNFLSYIGAPLSQLSPGTTTYLNNNLESSSEGTNVDLIEHATARLTLDYNPQFTHQKGAVWFSLDPDFDQYEAYGGSDQCSLYANDPTFSSSVGNSASTVIRAVSIYDPWFDEMEQMYDIKYAPEGWVDDGTRIANWKDTYLAMDDFQHRHGGKKEAVDNEKIGLGVPVEDYTSEEYDMFRYPTEKEASLYIDYQVTIREPIESVVFRSESQTQTNKDAVSTSMPSYAFLDDPIRHPDVEARDEIWCYDTTDASAGVNTVDAFYVSAEIMPDFGYTLSFEIVQGASIGTLNFDGIDEVDNAFRFVPHSGRTDASGKKVTNYGDVVIRVTAPDINYSKLFVLHYVPSNLRLVKYIGNDYEKWDVGIKLREATEEDLESNLIPTNTGYLQEGKPMIVDDASGEWDIYNDGKNDPYIYGLQILLLYPGEEFPLSLIMYTNDGTGASTKKPYYVTSGVPGYDTSTPTEDGGYEMIMQRYAIMYGLYEATDSTDPTPGIVEFDRYGSVEVTLVDGDRVTELKPSNRDTGTTYWYMNDPGETSDDVQWIKAGDKQGIYYLSYTVAPIDEETNEPSLDTGSITGGVYLIICDPVDQVLANTVNKKAGGNVSTLVPYMVSAGQRKPSLDRNGKPQDFPSHWYMGAYRGAVAEAAVLNGQTDEDAIMHRGYGYVSFDSDDTMVDLSVLRLQNKKASDISEVQLGSVNEYFLISNDRLPDADSEEGKKEPLYEPTLADIVVTGDYGLNRFPKILYLEIEDDNGMLTEANTIDGLFDFSTLNITHYKHTGMLRNNSSHYMDRFIAPHNIIDMDIGPEGDEAPNYLAATLEFPESAKGKLRNLDIDNNSFTNVTLDGFGYLERVSAAGIGEAATDADYVNLKDKDVKRYLNIVNCPLFELLEADGTLFQYLVVGFKTRVSSLTFPGVAASKEIGSGMHANSSCHLLGVNISGAVGYVELQDDENLDSVISSRTLTPDKHDVFTKSIQGANGYETLNWIGTLNLGGNNPLNNNYNNTYSFEDIAGFSPNRFSGSSSYFKSTKLPWKISKKDGSNNISTIKLDNIHRFFSDNNNTKPKLKTLEVNNLIGTSYASLPSGGHPTLTSSVFDFQLQKAKGASDQEFTIGYIGSKASMDISGSGIDSLTAARLEGYLKASDSSKLVSAYVNEGLGFAPSKSYLDLSNTAITGFSEGLRALSGMNIGLGSTVSIYPEEAIEFSVLADPQYYTIDPKFSYNSQYINVTENGDGTYLLVGVSPGSTTLTISADGVSSKSIPVTVIKPIQYKQVMEADKEEIELPMSGDPERIQVHVYNVAEEEGIKEDVCHDGNIFYDYENAAWPEDDPNSGSYELDEDHKVMWTIEHPEIVEINEDITLYDNIMEFTAKVPLSESKVTIKYLDMVVETVIKTGGIRIQPSITGQFSLYNNTAEREISISLYDTLTNRIIEPEEGKAFDVKFDTECKDYKIEQTENGIKVIHTHNNEPDKDGKPAEQHNCAFKISEIRYGDWLYNGETRETTYTGKTYKSNSAPVSFSRSISTDRLYQQDDYEPSHESRFVNGREVFVRKDSNNVFNTIAREMHKGKPITASSVRKGEIQSNEGSIKARVNSLNISECDELRTIDIATDDTINRSIKNLFANNCPNLGGKIDAKYVGDNFWEDLWGVFINLNGIRGSVSLCAESDMVHLEAYNDSGTGILRTANIQARDIEYIDMHGQHFGKKDGYDDEGSITLGPWTMDTYAYERPDPDKMWSWGSSADSDAFLWDKTPTGVSDYKFGLRYLDYLNLMDCGIYYKYGSGDRSSGAFSIAVHIGSGVKAEGSVIAWHDCNKINCCDGPHGFNFFVCWGTNHVRAFLYMLPDQIASFEDARGTNKNNSKNPVITPYENPNKETKTVCHIEADQVTEGGLYTFQNDLTTCLEWEHERFLFVAPFG